MKPSPSVTRGKILVSGGREGERREIAARFEMSKPAASQHLAILEGVGMVASEKHGQYVFHWLVPDNLINTSHGFLAASNRN